MIIAIATHRGCKSYQADANIAFLYETLIGNIYVEPPKGCVKIRSERKIYKLHKALCKLKQAPRK